MKQVVVIHQRDTDRRDYQRIGMEALVAAGYAVIVLNVIGFLRPGATDPRKGDEPLPGVQFVRIENGRDLRDAERKYLASADFVIMVVGLTGSLRTIQVYRAASRGGRPTLVLSSNAHPGFARYNEGGHGQRIADKVKRLMAQQVNPWHCLLARVPPAWLGIKPCDFIVYGGSASFSGAAMYPVAAETEAIHAHAMDYDLYLAERGKHPEGGNLAVFIDDCVGFNIDIQMMGEQSPVSPEEYYPRLRALFDRIEAELGLEVVVAANPRMDYRDHPGLFGPRRVEYGKTAALVAASKLVIGGRSTALGFAVLFRLPVLLVAMRAQRDHWINRPAFDFFSRDLHTPVRLFDDPAKVTLTDALDWDAEAYDRYLATYVKLPDAAELPYWQIVLERLAKAGILR